MIVQLNNYFFYFLLILLLSQNANAQTSDWDFIIPDKIQSPSRAHYIERNYYLFRYFLNNSLRSQGQKDFEKVIDRVRRRIFWKLDKHKKNVFVDAFERSYPQIKHYQLPKNTPQIILLIPYIESLWRAKAGSPEKDYGYWQLLGSIVEEIKALPSTSPYLKQFSIDKIRSHHLLSTRVALLHLQRYYFYFHHNRGFNKTDAWLFTMLAYNWGSGNVRRLLAEMKHKKIKQNFSSFYHYLYQQQAKDKDNRSLRSAVEYLPHLWNILLVIRQAEKQTKRRGRAR